MRANDAFQVWKAERDAVESEMHNLLSTAFPVSVTERRVRSMRFAVLIARRDAAARALLQSMIAGRRNGSKQRRDQQSLAKSRDRGQASTIDS